MGRFSGIRKGILIGGIAGIITAIAVAGSLETFFGKGLEGGWYDATRKDMINLFGNNIGNLKSLITIYLSVIFIIISGIGGLVGAFFGLLIEIFFSKLKGIFER
ncbi:MAG: hypothetical protein HZB81_04820 [Deltaproteobacteria bacterium]|nr:hypothetical protein [Deltaproteobacteria bacterium]